MPEPRGESEVSRAGAVTNNMDDVHDSDSEQGGFPLSIDLSSYVGTPAHCRVWVRARARKVRWLANRVRRAARLRGPLLLKAGECLLPPGEPLKVIRPDDTLSVARVEHNWQRPFSFHDDDEDSPKESHTAVASSSPVKSPLTLEPSPLEKPQPAKQKHIPLELSTEEQASVQPVLKRQHQNLTTEQTSEEPVVIDHEALHRVKQRALALLQQVTGEEIAQDVVDAPKKKRRRVRRRRPCKDVNLDFSVEAAESESMQNGSEFQIHTSNQDETLDDPDANAVENETVLQSQTSQSVVLTPPPVSAVPSPAVQLSMASVSAVPSPAVQLSMASVSAVPSPAVKLSMASVSAVPSPALHMAQVSAGPRPTILTYPPASVLVRNPTPPRAPRVVRALSTEHVLKMDSALVSTN